MFDRRLLKNFDYTLFIIVMLLIFVGLLMITSATIANPDGTNNYGFIKKQAIAFAVGAVLMILAISIDYKHISQYFWYIYGFNIFILLLVQVLGRNVNGAKSWIQYGSFSIQPSEFSKVLIIMFLGKLLADLREKNANAINDPKNLAVVLGAVAVPLSLILLQPDFGTAMVIVVIIAAMLFVANLSYKYFLGAGLAVMIAAPLLWFFKLHEYQRDRIKVFLNPDADPLNKGFQVIQSKIAIGSGSFFGKGVFHGTQTQMGFLPFKETDFIFSVIGEELGFFLSLIILILFGALLLKLVDTARKSKDFYGSVVVSGIAAMIGIHVFQNIGMTMGLMPVTGIPLPFISYGGTSLMANMIAIGLVLNISMRRQKITF